MVAATINPSSVALMSRQQLGEQRQKLLGLRAGVGGEQLLGLIQRQHQRRRRTCCSAGVGQPLARPRSRSLGQQSRRLRSSVVSGRLS